MDMRALRYFLAAFDQGSISAAARQCHVSQPSVTHAVRQLEEELGAILFERSVRGLTPTAPAIALAQRARAIVADVAELRASFRQNVAPQATIRLFVHATIALRKLSPLLAGLGAMENTDVRLTKARDEADLAIIPGEGDSREVLLWSEPYVLALPANHALASRERLCLADLVGVRLIARCSCERPHILPKDRVRPLIVAEAQDEESMMALVAAGFGVAIAPGAIAENPAVVVRQVEDFSVCRDVVAIGNPALVERARFAIMSALAEG